MEYEQHRGGIDQSVVSGPRIPGLRTTQTKFYMNWKQA